MAQPSHLNEIDALINFIMGLFVIALLFAIYVEHKRVCEILMQIKSTEYKTIEILSSGRCATLS